MKSEIIVNKNYVIGEIDRRIYGSFIEHLGRAVYGGIYEPSHETADECGFRKDVIELVKKAKVPLVRYPGGNFVSGYIWEDGIGDKAKRPKRLECAWCETETNEVGIDEFQQWAKKTDSEIMMAVNLGTRGADDAKNLLEYCNLDTDTYYANLRRENGFEKPFNIKTWCLGNEMDGPWQIGHKTAEEYSRLAARTASLMKATDPNIELVACGSSNYTMETFGSWELTLLDNAYEFIDYISVHQYYNTVGKDLLKNLAKSVYMDQFIKSVTAMCDAIKAKKHSKKTINISFDEWNVWKHNNDKEHENWQFAPQLFEDVYNFEDALLVGCMLMTLQNNCDRVKIACLAQLINVIAPIMTENDGKSWLQTIFYPYMYSSVYGIGTVMNIILNCDSYTVDDISVPYIQASVIHNEEKRELVVYAVNRSPEEDKETEIKFESFGDCVLSEHIYLYSDDIGAFNSVECERVAPLKAEVCAVKNTVQKVTLKKHSWNMLIYKY